jgi:hypothetical protein
MSIDWEISDKTMKMFGQEIATLNKKYKNNKIITGFLKLLNSLGKHIETNKADSHPNAIRLLNSVSDNLAKVFNPKIPVAEKVKIFRSDLAKFKIIKKEIAKGKAGVTKPRPAEAEPKPIVDEKPVQKIKENKAAPPKVAAKQAVTPPAAPQAPPQEGVMLTHEAFAMAVQEIKKTIEAEFSALRTELKLWRDER